MARYCLYIDFKPMRDKLAEIEQGGPLRKLEFPTLHSAIGTANMLRMAVGASCRKGPRAVRIIDQAVMSVDNVIDLHIVRFD